MMMIQYVVHAETMNKLYGYECDHGLSRFFPFKLYTHMLQTPQIWVGLTEIKKGMKSNAMNQTTKAIKKNWDR